MRAGNIGVDPAAFGHREHRRVLVRIVRNAKRGEVGQQTRLAAQCHHCILCSAQSLLPSGSRK